MLNNEKCWIKFYSKENLALYHTFEWSLPILDDFDASKVYNVNEILELFNIKLILEAVNCPKNMNEERFAHYRSFIKPIQSLVGRYFNSFDALKFLPILQTIENEYVDDFLNLLSCFKIIERIASKDICKALDEDCNLLHDILRQPKWVNQFDFEISEYMKESKLAAEILIHHYLEDSESMNVKFYMPKSLSPRDKVKILNQYIDGERFHPNYVGFIAKGKSCEDLPIDAKLRLKAEKAIEIYWRNNSTPGTILRLSAQSSFEYMKMYLSFCKINNS